MLSQVLINVNSVGLNFRDVLNVLGMYPGDPGNPGNDCAGVIAAVGSTNNIHHRWEHAIAKCIHLTGYSVNRIKRREACML